MDFRFNFQYVVDIVAVLLRIVCCVNSTNLKIYFGNCIWNLCVEIVLKIFAKHLKFVSYNRYPSNNTISSSNTKNNISQQQQNTNNSTQNTQQTTTMETEKKKNPNYQLNNEYWKQQELRNKNLTEKNSPTNNNNSLDNNQNNTISNDSKNPHQNKSKLKIGLSVNHNLAGVCHKIESHQTQKEMQRVFIVFGISFFENVLQLYLKCTC